MRQELADISTNESHKLKGFKVLGLFPFYLKYIRTDTHIQLSKIKEEIQKISKENRPQLLFRNAPVDQTDRFKNIEPPFTFVMGGYLIENKTSDISFTKDVTF